MAGRRGAGPTLPPGRGPERPPGEEPGGAPTPQPERREPRLRDPGLRSLSVTDYRAIVVRAGKETLADNVPMIASALAYSTFLAIPSVLLVVTGLFSLVAGPSGIETLMDKLGRIAPQETVTLLGDSLQRLNERPAAGIAMTAVGVVIALWSTTSAMTTLMTGLSIAYDVEDSRGFVRKRGVALAMTAAFLVAFLLVFGCLVLGPHLIDLVKSQLGLGGWVDWVWWAGQWPVLLLGLLAAFAALLYLGPNVQHPRWTFLTPGALVAVVVWLAASGGFAVYTSMFASYNKTWGSLAAVIVMLTWLWLTGLALLFGAEINAEAERSRELRRGEPAERELQVEPRA